MNGDDRVRLDRIEEKIDKIIDTLHVVDTRVQVHEKAEDAHGLSEVKGTLKRYAGGLAVLVFLVNIAIALARSLWIG